jgi:hypothetical protein
MNTEQASQGIAIPGVMIPPVSTISTKKSGAVDMTRFRKALFLVGVGAFGASATVDAKIQESVDTTDGNFTDVTGGAVTQLVAAGGDNRIVILEIGAGSLSAGKKFTRVVVTVGTAATLVTAFALGADAAQKPGSQNNDTSVAQRLVV